jgi:hypothetical protein
MNGSVRWSVTVSRETDLSLRTYLGSQGARKGDLSKFIEEAVHSYLLHRTVQEIRERNAGTDSEELQRLIDEAVREARTDRYAAAKTDKA